MPQVQEVKVINIDEVPYAVDAMSEKAQRLVEIYNEWNQKEADIRNELMIIQAAKETLSRQIIEQVRAEKAEAEKAAAESATEAPAIDDAAVAPAVAPAIDDAAVAPAVAPAVAVSTNQVAPTE